MTNPTTERTTPLTIAIAGCSCSGKTTLANLLAESLNGVILPVDAYYRDLSHLKLRERSQVNFDDPAAIDGELLLRDFQRLAAGEVIARPVYDFTRHLRTQKTVVVEPAAVVILEGLFALHWKPVRESADARVFVELDDDLCLSRRLKRDISERGRTRESVTRQYNETVRPMAAKFIIPTRAFADLVVRGDSPPEDSARRVSEWLLGALKEPD